MLQGTGRGPHRPRRRRDPGPARRRAEPDPARRDAAIPHQRGRHQDRADDAPRRDADLPPAADRGGRQHDQHGPGLLAPVEQARVAGVRQPASDGRSSGRPQGPAPRAGRGERDPFGHPAPPSGQAARTTPTRLRPRRRTRKPSRRCGGPTPRARPSGSRPRKTGWPCGTACGRRTRSTRR